MNKIAVLMKRAAQIIREQDKENKSLKEEIKTIRKKEGFKKLAEKMADRGIIPISLIDKKATAMMNSNDNLETWERAVDLAIQKHSSIISGTIDDFASTSSDPFSRLCRELVYMDED